MSPATPPTGAHDVRERFAARDETDALRYARAARTAAMGAPLERSRLAVAITKTDLLTEHGLVPARTEDSDDTRTWLRDVLGLRSLVRAMDVHFREVRFFRTAAVADERAGVDAGVTGFGDRCLRS